jgi:hypothetical protein
MASIVFLFLTEQDYRYLAMFFAQRFVPDCGGQDKRRQNEIFGQQGPLNYKSIYESMSPEQKKAFQAKYQRVQQRVMKMMRAMPSQLFLVCR